MGATAWEQSPRLLSCWGIHDCPSHTLTAVWQLPWRQTRAGWAAWSPPARAPVEACLRLGIEPGSLRFRPLDAFQLSGQASDLAELAYNFNEAVRQARLRTLGSKAQRTPCTDRTSVRRRARRVT